MTAYSAPEAVVPGWPPTGVPESRRLRSRKRNRLPRFWEGGKCLADEFILETHGLTKEFAGFFAVRDVALKVRRGHIHALIGPKGAGKETCFNLLTKFLKPSAGTILYKGRDITAMAPADVAGFAL